MGLIIAAAITTGLALLAIGAPAWRMARPADRRMLGLAFLIALPLQPLVFYVVRLPLDGLVRAMLGLGKSWGMVALLYAPLTEEPAKWLPLAVPPVANALAPANAVPLALVIGLGFGIGEILVPHPCAGRLSDLSGPAVLDVLRLRDRAARGLFAARRAGRIPDRTAGTGRNVLAGAVAGMALHLLINFPIYPAQIDVFGLGGPAWSIIVMGWVAALAVAGAIMLWRLHRRLLRGPG